MAASFHNVADLSPETRSAVESLVGHPLRDGQKLYIAVLERVAPSESQREQALAGLQGILNQAHENARASGLSDEDIERLIDETCEEVRYGKQD